MICPRDLQPCTGDQSRACYRSCLTPRPIPTLKLGTLVQNESGDVFKVGGIGGSLGGKPDLRVSLDYINPDNS